jgi:hypothetical protein
VHLSNYDYYFKYLKSLDKEKMCDENEINLILYQYILEMTEVIYPERTPIYYFPGIYNKINPEYIEFLEKENDTIIEGDEKSENYLKKIDDGNYKISNGIETKIIKEKDYNLEMLGNDIKCNRYYPLNIILYKNESISHYYESKKNFIERESKKLYESFKNYFFDFLQSKSCMDILSKPIYKNIKEILQNEKNIRKIILNDNYFKFMPFYINQFSGFTNKDILLSVISSYPSLVQLLPKRYEKEKYKDIKNFCLLMALGEKFVTILHEQIIHFLYGYLFHLTKAEGIKIFPKKSEKKKEDKNENDLLEDEGCYYFESQLFGHIISKLTIANVIALFDGKSIKKTNINFQSIFNSAFSKNKLLDMIRNCSGFLSVFLEAFPIDFEYIIDLICKYDNPYISLKGNRLPYIEIPNHYKKDLYINII